MERGELLPHARSRLNEVGKQIIAAYTRRFTEHSVESHRDLLEHQAAIRALAPPIVPAEDFEVKSDWRAACTNGEEECDIMVYRDE